jgi:hypothetical protein
MLGVKKMKNVVMGSLPNHNFFRNLIGSKFLLCLAQFMRGSWFGRLTMTLSLNS